MNKKLVVSIMIAILVILGIIAYLVWRDNCDKNKESDNVKIEELQKNEVIRKFNFETKTVKLNSEYEMPINGIGTYSLTGETCYNSITSALNLGVRLIDTAYMYNNEEEIGRAIKDSNVDRDEIFIITKIYPSQFSDPEGAIKMAFEKLGVEYIDMMLLHHPGDGDVEAYKAMENMLKKGRFILLDYQIGM